jgi:hypothetical protein
LKFLIIKRKITKIITIILKKSIKIILKWFLNDSRMNKKKKTKYKRIKKYYFLQITEKQKEIKPL